MDVRSDKRQFWVILIIVFLGFMGISMPYLIFPSLFLNPLLSILPESWGESSRAIYLGITLAAYPLGQFIGSPILGSLSDDYGRKNLLSASLVLSALCYLLTGFAIDWHHLELLILSRFVAGFMEGNIAIARAMAADIVTISKHESFGKINAVSSIAFLVGPLLGGLMSDSDVSHFFSASTPFYFICLLFLFLSGITIRVLKESIAILVKVKRSFWQRINLPRRLSLLFLDKHLRFLMITSTCFTLAVDIFYEFGPVYLTVKWILSPAQLVLYNGVVCIALAIGNAWLPHYISPRISVQKAIIYSMAGFAVSLIGIVVTSSTFVMIFLFILNGLTIGLVSTLATVQISNAASDDIQGEVMGTQVSLRVLGDAIICLFGGVLLLFSPKLILIFASIISVIAMIYYKNNHQKKCVTLS